MEKSKRTAQIIVVGFFMTIIIIFINRGMISEGSGKQQNNQSNETLEEILMQVEGIGQILIYYYHEQPETAHPLSDYFGSSSRTTTLENGRSLQGVLVVAEGADDPRLKRELLTILSTVLQLPEHRIIIVEMKKRGAPLESE